MSQTKIQIYDTTLRDGTQAEEISFTVEDKIRVAERLDEVGVDYIEGGWPGSNPKDNEFFVKAKKLSFKNAKLAAFGSTRRKGVAADSDKILLGLIKAKTPVITIFGKSWDLHVREALHATLEENLEIIFDSIQFLKKHTGEVIYDAEHFFDGYKANPEYCLKTLKAAVDAGADRLVLCDTNGGSLPTEIFEFVTIVSKKFSIPLGIHCHNDAELGVANSLAAVQAGATQIHGTINGIGERCGNANLISVIPNLKLKMENDCVTHEQLKKLKSMSRFVYELANRKPQNNQAYVGDSAFAHKGGVHVSAILKNQRTYEHILPELVGNHRRVLISDLAGQSNILYKAQELGIELDPKNPVTKKVVDELKHLESQGYQFEGAEASFEILMKRALQQYKPFFKLLHFKVIDEKGPRGPRSTATLEISVDKKKTKTTATGQGPINALDHALRKALRKFYPQIKDVELVDYKVRVLPAGKGTASQVRVLIESKDATSSWGTVGVSENIIEASWQALVDALEYKLLK